MTKSRLYSWALCALVLGLVSITSGAQSAWQFIPTSNTPPVRQYGASLVYDQANDRLIMFGGNLASTGQPTDQVWVLAGAFNGPRTWTQLFPTGSAIALANHGAVYDAANNRMIVFGGCMGSCMPVTNYVQILTNANGLGGTPQWIVPSIPGPLPGERHSMAVAYDALFNSLIVFGGHNGGGQINSLTTFSDTWILTNANGLGGAPTWYLASPPSTGPNGRYGPTSAYDPNTQRMIVSGGISAAATATNGTWLFNLTAPQAGNWQNIIGDNVPGNPPAFSHVRSTYDAASKRLFVPLTNNATGSKDLWVLENESVWKKLAPPAFGDFARSVDATMYRADSNTLMSFFSGAALNALYAIQPQFNQAPTFIAPSPADGASFTLRAGQMFSAQFWANDADAGDQLTMQVVGLPPGASSGTNGPANPVNRNIDWRPGYLQTGTHNITMSVDDGKVSVPRNITINVTPNSPPVFGGTTPFAPINVQAGQHVHFVAQAFDADADDGFTVNVDVSTLPAGAGSGGSGFGNPASRDFDWTPGNNDAGPHVVRFSATDLAGQMTLLEVTINVAANTPPVFVSPTPTQPLSVNAGSPLNFSVNALDNDPGQTLSMFVDFNTVPSGMSVSAPQGLNPSQINFSWTPQGNQAGSHTISVRATDNLGTSTTQQVTINVQPVTLVSIAVTPSSVSKHFGSQTFTATGTFSDGSTQTLPSGAPQQISGGTLWQTFFSPNINAGLCDASIQGGFASQAFSVQNGNVHEVWSPVTPVLHVDGTINSNTVTLALSCSNNPTTGSINATWTGTRYEGTFTLGAQAGNVSIRGWSTKAPMPSPRYGHAAATAGSKIYVIGGVSNFDVLDSVAAYDTANDTWTSGLASMPTPRAGHGAVAVGGKIYVIGGSGPGDIPTGAVEVYDPVNNSWSTNYEPMPTPRAYGMTVEANGKIYVIGGHTGSNNTGIVGNVEVYDTAADMWSILAPMPTARHFATAGVLSNTIIVVGSGPTEKYNIGTNTWSAGVNIPGGRGGLAGGVTNGGFFVFGGQSGSSLADVTLVYYLQDNFGQEGWATLGSMPTPRTELAAAVVGDVVYGIGGQTTINPPTPGVTTLTALSTPLAGHLQTGFGSSGSSLPTVQWSSSNPQSVTIDASGNAQAQQVAGQATIIATAGNISCQGSQCATFTVTNNAPTVQINGGPFTWNESTNTLFIGATSNDSDGDMLTREWSILSGPGTLTQPANSFSQSFRNDDGPGVTTIQFKATDSFGATTIAMTTVTTNNVAPNNISIFSGGSIQEGSTFNTNGNFQDPGADTWTATVDYGDGSGTQPLALNGKNFTLNHFYAESGSYTIKITVTDDDGGVGIATRTLFVNNVQPQVTLNVPNSVDQGQPLNAGGFFTDPGADSWTATVNYGDGTGTQPLALQPNKQFVLSHTYAIAGTYGIQVRVLDDDGAIGSAFRQITVNLVVNAPPFSQVPNTPAGACICTQRGNLTNQMTHSWFVKADNSGQLTVTLAAPVTGPNASTIESRVTDANGTQLAATSVSYPANSNPDDEFRSPMVITSTPGAVYRVDVRAPNQSFARYWLRFDGAVEAGTGSPTLPSIEGGNMTWLINVDANDPVALRLYSQGVPQGGSATGDVAVQWIAPDGQAQPVQTLNVPLPAPPAFVDMMIPPPANLSSGIWRLRLSTGFDYRLDKQSGVDRGLYLDHLSSGRGQIKLHVVDGNGNPLAGTINATVNFGNSFSFPIVDGLFETDTAEAFTYHVQLEVPDGYQTATSEFDITVTCDQLTEITVVMTAIPPAMTVELSPNTIWPPNNKMVTVTATISASSPNGHATTIELVSITNNETGANDVAGAAFGTDDRTFQLRATRLGGGSGRTYTITYRATDTVTGATTLVTATVVVPHDQGQ